ncbi:pantothenate synthetase [Caldinitratiruptor microaerophilus]|uniref:Pantothenate synthetase n=2 Tax=Caldinitratiruptor microaerophilus TaxID=671077 RepID=A0AA35G9P8_9FIRM|nr:pantothenate synthetase [Caldinitratiruptor microaerophilus]
MRERSRAWRAAKCRHGFVPTMGYLHEGHMALVERARANCDVVTVSIFVNPLQFGPQEDYARYPRDLDRDLAMLREARVDAVFAPSVAEMYPEEPLVFVEPTRLSDHLCGASRPGHFRGVATVVLKLFNIVQPDVAYFGEKDAQQLAIIRRMVRDLNVPVEIVGVPTVRAADGLALSSRNAYLGPEERAAAPVLYRALQLARDRILAGERDPGRVKAAMRECIAAEPQVRIDYVEIVDAGSLQPVERIEGRVLVAVAAFAGPSRLIDNVTVDVPAED